MREPNGFNLGPAFATSAAIMLLFLLGIAAGGTIGNMPIPVTAQNPGEEEVGGGGGGGSYCEDDACAKIVRRWWWDTYRCAETPNSQTGCDLIDVDLGCVTYQCN